MPKAVIATATGATISIEGTQEEILAMVTRLEGQLTGAREGQPIRSEAEIAKRRSPLVSLLLDLLAEGFLREPRELGVVGAALAERGHFYPATTLSPALLRLVRQKKLRRLKQKGRWVYVG